MTEQHARSNSRMVLLLIAGIPVTIILAATWLWWFVLRGDLDIVGTLGTSNRGELVQPPRALYEAPLVDRAGQPVDFPGREPRWTMLVAWSGADCNAKCEHLLYLTRQIQKAMGKDMRRLQRLFVSPLPAAGIALSAPALSDGKPLPGSLEQLLDRDHGRLRDLRLERSAFDRLFAEQLQAEDTWYLVDPQGWVMMAYDDSVSYKEVMADLKFLLKNSGG